MAIEEKVTVIHDRIVESTYRIVLAAVVGLLFVAPSAEAGIIVMDFEVLAMNDDQSHQWGSTYTAGDWELNLPEIPGGQTIQNQLETYGMQHPNYAGSTGGHSQFVGDAAFIILNRVDDAPFGMQAIALSVIEDGDTKTVEFTGKLNGGGTVMTSFTTSSGSLGFETFSFAGLGFDDIISLNWVMQGPDGVHQFDNLEVVPEPGTAALLGLGLASLGVVRRSRREESQGAA
jgi:hypothetical protein